MLQYHFQRLVLFEFIFVHPAYNSQIFKANRNEVKNIGNLIENVNKIPLTLAGVLVPVSAHAATSAEYSLLHVSAKSPSNVSPNRKNSFLK